MDSSKSSLISATKQTPVVASKTASNLIACRRFFGDVDNDKEFKGFGEDDPLLLACKQKRILVNEHLKILKTHLREKSHPYHHHHHVQQEQRQTNPSSLIRENQKNNSISSVQDDDEDDIDDYIDEGDENNLKKEEETFQGFSSNDPLRLSLLQKKKTIQEEQDKLLQLHFNSNNNSKSAHYRLQRQQQQQDSSLCNGNHLRETEDEIVDTITQRLNISKHNNSNSNSNNNNTNVIEQQLDVSSFLENSSSSSASTSSNSISMMTQDIDVSNNDQQEVEMESSEDAMTQLLDISDQAPSMEISKEPTSSSSSSNNLLPMTDVSKDDVENEFDSDISSVKKQMKRLLPGNLGNFVAVKGPRVKQVSHSSGYVKKLPIAKFGDHLEMPSRNEDCLKYVEGKEETTFDDVEESSEESDESAKEEAFLCRQNGTTVLDYSANIKCLNSPLSMEEIAISGFPVIAVSPFTPPKPSCFLCGSSSTEILISCSVCCEPYHPYCCGDESLNQWCRTSVKIEKTEMMRKEKTGSNENNNNKSDEKNNDLLISPSFLSPPLTPVPSDLDLNFVQLKEQFLTWTCKRCLICQSCGKNKKSKQSSTNSTKSKSPKEDECEFIKCSHCRGPYHIACLGKRLECGLVEDFEPSCSSTTTNTTTTSSSSSSSLISPIDPKKNWNCPNCTKCRSCGIQIENNGILEKKSKKSKGNSLMLCQECFSQRQKGSFCPLCNVSYDDDDYDTRMMECARCERWIHAKCEEISEEQYQVLSHLPESIEYICKLCCDTDTKKPAWYQAVIMDIVNGCESVLNVFTKKAVTETRKRRALDFDILPSIQEDVNSIEYVPKNTENLSPIINFNSDNDTSKPNTSSISSNLKLSESESLTVMSVNSYEKCPNEFPVVIKQDKELVLSSENTTDSDITNEFAKSRILTPTKLNDNNKKIQKIQEKLSTEKGEDEPSLSKTLKLSSNTPQIINKLSRKSKRKSDLVTRLGLRTRTKILECNTKSFTSKTIKNKKVNNPVEVYELSDGSFIDIKDCQVALIDILKYPTNNDELSNVISKALERKNSCISSTTFKEEENNKSLVVVCKKEEEEEEEDDDEQDNSGCNDDDDKIQLLPFVDEKKIIEKMEQKEDINILLKHDLDNARTKFIELTPKKVSTFNNSQEEETKTPINTTPRALFTPSKKVACFVDLVKSKLSIGSLLSVLYFKEASLDILEEYYTDVDVTRREKLKSQFNDSLKEVFTWFDEVMIKKSDLIIHQKFVKSSNGLCRDDDEEEKKKYELNPFQNVFWDGLTKDGRVCSFCGDNGDFPEDGRGRLLWAGLTEWIHINCVLWSSEVWEEEDGALQQVQQALNRSKTISCAYCQKKGASLTCCSTQCRNTYHFHCALLADCVLQLDKTIFCPKHPKEQFEEDSIQYEYQVYRKVFVDLELLKKKEKPVCSSKVKVFIGSLRIENLGQIIPLSVINNLQTRNEWNDNNENMETLLISNNYKCKRFFWSNQNPFEKVQYDISATVKKDWFRSFAKRKLPTEVNIVIDHSKDENIVQKKINNMKSFHNWIDSIPKMIDEYNVEWIPACPLLFSDDDDDDEDGKDKEDDDNNEQMEIDMKSEILENEDQEMLKKLNLANQVYWTHEDILKNRYEEEEPFSLSPVDSQMFENEDDKPPGCILNFNLDMDDQSSNFDDLDMLESPPSKITTTTNSSSSISTNYIHTDSKGNNDDDDDDFDDNTKNKRRKINDKQRLKLDKEREGSIDPSSSISSDSSSQIKTRRKTRSMTLLKYAMLDGAINDSSSEASYSSSSSATSGSSSSSSSSDEEEEEETEQTTESSSSTTTTTEDDSKLSKKAKKSSLKGRISNITEKRGRQNNIGGQRVTRNRSQVLAHSSKKVSSSPTKTLDSPGRKLRNRDNLQQKKQEKIVASTTEIECPSCQKPFLSQTSLNRHSRWCKPQKKIPAAVKRTSSVSTVDSSSSNGGPSTSKKIQSSKTSKLSSKGLKLVDEDDDDADYQIEEDEEEEDDSLSSEPTLIKTRKNSHKKRRIIESEDSNSGDILNTQITTRTFSEHMEEKKEEEEQEEQQTQHYTTNSKAPTEKIISLNDDEDKPKTCSKCKLTYRTLASFNKHLPNCIAYSSSDDDDNGEEKTNDDNLRTMNNNNTILQSVQATSTSPKNHENQQENNNNSTGNNNTSPVNVTSTQEFIPSSSTCDSDESSNSSSTTSESMEPSTENLSTVLLTSSNNLTKHECVTVGEVNQNNNKNILDQQISAEQMETSCSISTLELNQQQQEQMSNQYNQPQGQQQQIWQQSNQGYNEHPSNVQPQPLTVSNNIPYTNNFYVVKNNGTQMESLHQATSEFPQQQTYPAGSNSPGYYNNAPSYTNNAAVNTFQASGNTYNAPNYGSGGSPGTFTSSQNGQTSGNLQFGGDPNSAYSQPVYAPAPAPFQQQQAQPYQQFNNPQQQSYTPNPTPNYQTSHQSQIYPTSPQNSYSGQTNFYPTTQSYNGASNPYLTSGSSPSPAQFVPNNNNSPPQPPVYNPNPTPNNFNNNNNNFNNFNNFNTQPHILPPSPIPSPQQPIPQQQQSFQPQQPNYINPPPQNSYNNNNPLPVTNQFSNNNNNNNNHMNNGNSILVDNINNNNIGANTNVTYILVQQGNTISSIPVNSSSLNTVSSVPFQTSPSSVSSINSGGGEQQIVNFSEQQQILNPHSVINPVMTRNVHNNSNVINSSSSSTNMEFQQQHNVPNSSFPHCCNMVQQGSHCPCVGPHQILVQGQNQQQQQHNNNSNNNINSSDTILNNTNKILTGNTFMKEHVEMELPWKIIPQSSSNNKKKGNIPGRTGVQLLPKILPAVKTSPLKMSEYNNNNNNDVTGSLTQGSLINDTQTVTTSINFSPESNLHTNTNVNIMSSTGKGPISSTNIAVVRPLENPLIKMSQQISNLSMNFNNNNNNNSLTAPNTIQQMNNNNQEQILEETGNIIHPSQVSTTNLEKQIFQQQQTNYCLTTTTTEKLNVMEEKDVNLSTCMNDNIQTNNNSKQDKNVASSSSYAVAQENSNQETKSIKVVLRSKKDGMSTVEDINKSELKTVGAMRSLKIKGKIKSGENAGASTDIVIVPIVKTIPAISKFIIDENNEPKFELVEDNDDSDEDLAIIKPFNMPKRAHRAVIVYEVKCSNAVLFRSSDVRAVWQHVFNTVQGKRLENNLPPLSYPTTNICLPDNKQEAASSCDILGLTHQAVQFLLEQLPGKNSVLEKHKFRFHEPKKDEESLLPINESGCARTEAFSYQKRKAFDIFGWLSSKFRSVPSNVDISSVDSTLSSPDLPVAMRFRNLQSRASKSLVVRYSPIHGRGLYTRRTYTEGEMIIEYAGELIRTILSDKREKEYESKGIGCYFFTIDELVICDATKAGNQARFINHSCDPNCRSKIVEILGKKHILIFAIRKILAGEELTYDYKFAIESNEKKIKCTCGTKKCRKYLN